MSTTRYGQRSARGAALKVGHYADVEDFKWYGDRFNYNHWFCCHFHGNDAKSNRHHHGTRVREAYRQAARFKVKHDGY